jgi:hypothetical protein
MTRFLPKRCIDVHDFSVIYCPQCNFQVDEYKQYLSVRAFEYIEPILGINFKAILWWKMTQGHTGRHSELSTGNI